MKISKLEQLVSTPDLNKKREPALNTGITVASVAAALVVIIQFFFPNISEEVLKTLYAVLLILIPLVTALLVRFKVWSPASVEIVVDEAVAQDRELRSPGPKLIERPKDLGDVTP